MCVILQEAKNLASATESKTVAGEEKQISNDKILDFAWQMKKRGLAEGTIRNRTRALNALVKKGADLDNPDSVETVFATERFNDATKRELVRIYHSFAKAFKIEWIPIKVKYEPKQPFIPLETELDQLVASCGKRTATFLQVLKDTGARSGEATKLRWTDVNGQNRTISINNPEKSSRSRTVRVSEKTIAMINAMPKKYGDYIFNPNRQSLRESFWLSKQKLAHMLQNPRLKQIHFHTFRHWKATMEYHKTKDILHVMNMLGHKSIQNTLIYTQLLNFENEEYHSATARTIEEAKQLIESGFEYVTDLEGVKLFRKRK